MRSRPRALVDMEDALWTQVQEALADMSVPARSRLSRTLSDRGYLPSERTASNCLAAILRDDPGQCGLRVLVAISEVLKLPLPALAAPQPIRRPMTGMAFA